MQLRTLAGEQHGAHVQSIGRGLLLYAYTGREKLALEGNSDSRGSSADFVPISVFIKPERKAQSEPLSAAFGGHAGKSSEARRPILCAKARFRAFSQHQADDHDDRLRRTRSCRPRTSLRLLRHAGLGPALYSLTRSCWT